MTSPDLPETADPDLCRRVRLLGDILSVSATAQASDARQSTLKEWAYSADKRPIHRLQFDRMVVLFSMLEGKRDVAWAITTFAMDALESVAPAEARRARVQRLRRSETRAGPGEAKRWLNVW